MNLQGQYYASPTYENVQFVIADKFDCVRDILRLCALRITAGQLSIMSFHIFPPLEVVGVIRQNNSPFKTAMEQVYRFFCCMLHL
jgi:hypothetical protein